MDKIQITFDELGRFIEAEVRLEIIKKAVEQETYLSNNDLRRMLGMEVVINA